MAVGVIMDPMTAPTDTDDQRQTESKRNDTANSPNRTMEPNDKLSENNNNNNVTSQEENSSDSVVEDTNNDDQLPSLKEIFRQVVTWIRESEAESSSSSLSTSDKLRLYGLYKQSTVGPVKEEDDQVPSRWNVTAYAKYQAHAACQQLTQEQAMEAYLRLVAAQATASDEENSVSYKCQQLLTTYDQQQPKSTEDSKAITKVTDTTVPVSSLSSPCWKIGPGISIPKPFLIPRGQLDISYRDLGFATYQTLQSMLWDAMGLSIWNKRYEQQLHQRLTQSFVANSQNTSLVAGYAVRSLLDLYLSVQQFPSGSQVIMSPPINVPGMLQVFAKYGIDIVPIDLPLKNKSEDSNDESDDGIHQTLVHVDCVAIEAAITSQTVAIMVVHPFGIVSANDNEMKRLRTVVDYVSTKEQRTIHILEDCSESFTGIGSRRQEASESTHNTQETFPCYMGSPCADLCFFSFGLIKTSTALGGGLVLVKPKGLASEMTRTQQSIFQYQSRLLYLWKIFKAFLSKIIGESPVLYGLLAFLVQCVGFDFDALVTSTLRGFSARDPRDAKISQEIRKKPSVALLSLMDRRIRQLDTPEKRRKSSVRLRIIRCQKLAKSLQSKYPKLVSCFHNISPQSSFWLYPVLSEDADVTSRLLRRYGFDTTRGASQLRCVSLAKKCPRASSLMDNILYVPVSGPSFPSSYLDHLSKALCEAGKASKFNQSSREPSNVTARPSFWSAATFALLLILAFTPISVAAQFIGYGLLISLAMCSGTLVSAHVLRWSIAKFYLKSSDSFARYAPLVLSDETPSKNPNGRAGKDAETSVGPILSSIDGLQIPICDKEEERCVLLTGATGFVGSKLFHDLLLYRKRLSIGKIIVLCRAKRGLSAHQRIQKTLDRNQFSFLSTEERNAVVQVITGDVTKPNAGLSDRDLQSLRSEKNLSHIFHLAASVSFTQTLPEAARANISSALYLQDLAVSLAREDVRFVHVSTAFVHGGLLGTESEPLPERLFSLSQYDPSKIYESMLGTQYYASKAMKDLGFHNSYTFSKCVCEHLLARAGGIRTIIIRPTIVGPAIETPYEGWAGSKPSTLVAAACLYLAYQWNLWSFGREKVPVIPVDVVCNFIVAKAFSSDGDEPRENNDLSSEESYEKVSPCPSLRDSDSDFGSDSIVTEKPPCIFNAAWNVTSPKSASFTWLDYAVNVTQMGSVFGFFSRPTAYIGLLFTARLLPMASLSKSQFQSLHSLLVVWPFACILKLCRTLRFNVSSMEKVLSFLDLPLLFYPFMNNEFCFQSEIIASSSVDGARYLVSCTDTACTFLEDLTSRRSPAAEGGKRPSRASRLRSYRIGGVHHRTILPDLWWALTQPCGDYFTRFAGFVLAKLFRVTCSEITVDAVSFASISSFAAGRGPKIQIILAPTHRSLYDFLVLSFTLFSIPELQLDLPFIAAADDFQTLPFIGFMVSRLRTFFVQRGNRSHEQLRKDVKKICGSQGSVIEIYIEGTRSRDRRFVEPKTGLMRCLKEEGDCIIVPVCINYERIPEQSLFAAELGKATKSKMSVLGLASWLWSVARGDIKVGRIHVSASSPVVVDDHEPDMKSLASNIQASHQEATLVSAYHMEAGSRLLGLERDIVREALAALGCKEWRSLDFFPAPYLDIPSNSSELTTVFFQASPQLAKLFQTSHPQWSSWLNRLSVHLNEPSVSSSPAASLVAMKLGSIFDKADACSHEAIRELKARGFVRPTKDHVYQIAAETSKGNVPRSIQMASVELCLGADDRNVRDSPKKHHVAVPGRVGSRPKTGNEALGFWGYQDSSFVVRMDSSGTTYVSMEGTRYSLCDRRVPNLLPFIESETQVRINLLQEAFSTAKAPSVCPSRLLVEDFEALKEAGCTCSVKTEDRIRHGTGHCQEDVYQIRHNGGPSRVPDACVWPTTEDSVEKLVEMASERAWCLIPFGGGTNVSQSTRCPSLEVEPRPILSVDMRKLSRILWIDEENGVAKVQAGITGAKLVEGLAARGYTMGHEPDSLEFSTLGGWIATKASGMKRSKYGNIEDIVRSVRVVGAKGVLEYGNDPRTVWGREAVGPTPLDLLLGSEGCVGIITTAVIRIWPLPEVTDFDAVLFADFETGLEFVRDVARKKKENAGSCPSSIRLLDNEHFRLGQALSPQPSSTLGVVWKAVMSSLVKTKAGFESKRVVCATISFEGTRREVATQKRTLRRLSSAHGGIHLGAQVGKAGYELTFMIAYLRDFAMTFHFLGESFETFVPWSKVTTLVNATKKRIQQEHADRLLPGRPFVGCRVTQLYHEGACLYFYLCMNVENVPNSSAVFSELEHAARQEILLQGGNLSHHHGVGKVRASFLTDIQSPALKSSVQAVKNGLDPDNIFGARNGAYSST